MSHLKFKVLLREVRNCTACADHLQLPPKPVLQVHPEAAILIIAQAPGTRARASGLPFDDASGDRLRAWLDVDRTVFYDETKIALMPMGFCYPGKSAGGDLPPCPGCAPLWHDTLRAHLLKIKLTLFVGTYAQRYYLQMKSVTEAVRNWRKYSAQNVIPLPHPSWHNNAWIVKHLFFERELLPSLRKKVQEVLGLCP